MGAHFRQPAFHSTPDQLFTFLEKEKAELVGTDVNGEDVRSFKAPDRLAVVVGNEGAGMSDMMRGKVRRNISIPIQPGVESLNVSVATGILLHALRA
jgi:tRNA G18 (ribose-2'-O)-methylase SpoU